MTIERVKLFWDANDPIAERVSGERPHPLCPLKDGDHERVRQPLGERIFPASAKACPQTELPLRGHGSATTSRVLQTPMIGRVATGT